MILKFLIEIISFLGVSFIQLFSGLINTPDLSSYVGTTINSVIAYCTQAINFLYFLLGDFLQVIVPLILILVPVRFMIAPIVAFLRGFIRWGS